MRPDIRSWLHRIWKRSADPETQIDAVDSWVLTDRLLERSSDGLNDLLEKIEETALAVYAANGLPVRRGHYEFSPRTKRWRFLSESLSPEERWTLALTKPANTGWRFAILEHLGADATVPEVVSAARLLASARRLKSGLPDGNPALMRADLEDAIQVGAEWRLLQQNVDWRSRARLKLAPPARSGKRKAQDWG